MGMGCCRWRSGAVADRGHRIRGVPGFCACVCVWVIGGGGGALGAACAETSTEACPSLPPSPAFSLHKPHSTRPMRVRVGGLHAAQQIDVVRL